MIVRIERKKVPVEMGQTVDIDMSEFGNNDDNVDFSTVVPMPFDATSLQLVVISHVRTDEEQAAYEAAVSGQFAKLLENLDHPDEL